MIIVAIIVIIITTVITAILIMIITHSVFLLLIHYLLTTCAINIMCTPFVCLLIDICWLLGRTKSPLLSSLIYLFLDYTKLTSFGAGKDTLRDYLLPKGEGKANYFKRESFFNFFINIPFNPETDEYPYPIEAVNMTYDGLHPSDKGYKVISKILVKVLK